MLWGMTSESVLRAQPLLGNEERDVDADKPDAIGNGAGQNDGAAEVKNASLAEDMIAATQFVSVSVDCTRRVSHVNASTARSELDNASWNLSLAVQSLTWLQNVI
jgi:hypothetical protein